MPAKCKAAYRLPLFNSLSVSERNGERELTSGMGPNLTALGWALIVCHVNEHGVHAVQSRNHHHVPTFEMPKHELEHKASGRESCILSSAIIML